MKQGLLFIAVIAAIIGGAVFLSNSDETETTAVPSDHFYGLESSPVVLTEFGDFQCPACGSFFPLVNQIKEEFKDQIRFEFKNFPLVQIHQNAIAAHRAAEAASNQGKFFEMHDLLYSQQQSWSGSSNPSVQFETYAEQLGLDMDKYRLDVASSETLATINADVALGKDKGANSTPTFYLNGQKIEDLTPISTIEGFRSVIQEAIDKTKPADSSANEDISTPPTDNIDTEQTAQPENSN